MSTKKASKTKASSNAGSKQTTLAAWRDPTHRTVGINTQMTGAAMDESNDDKDSEIAALRRQLARSQSAVADARNLAIVVDRSGHAEIIPGRVDAAATWRARILIDASRVTSRVAALRTG